jgi:hypothetical protein
LHELILGYRSDFGSKKNKKISYPDKTFDNRRQTDVLLELSQDDVLRQSGSNLFGYSFGFPSDDSNKENKSIQSQLGIKTRVKNPNIKNTLLKSYKGVSKNMNNLIVPTSSTQTY